MKRIIIGVILSCSISFGFSQSVSNYTLADYYEFFYKADLAEILGYDYKTAFDAQSMYVYELDTLNNQLEFRTQNTPPSWDGDSESEYYYNLVFWEKENGSRVILKLESEITWVSEETLSMEFFIHNKKGIRPYKLLDNELNFDFFTEKENHSDLFSQDFLDEPPYYVYDVRNDTIIVAFGIHEYYEPIEAFDTFDSLDITTYDILIDPLQGKYTKRIQR